MTVPRQGSERKTLAGCHRTWPHFLIALSRHRKGTPRWRRDIPFPFQDPNKRLVSDVCSLPGNFLPDLLTTGSFPPSNWSTTVASPAALSAPAQKQSAHQRHWLPRTGTFLTQRRVWGGRGLFTFENEKAKVGALKYRCLPFAGRVARRESKSLLASGQVHGNTPLPERWSQTDR